MADARWRVEACHPRPTAALGVAFGGCHPRRGGAASRHDPASPTAAHAGDRARGHDVPRRDGARRDGAPSRPGAEDRPRRRTDARRGRARPAHPRPGTRARRARHPSGRPGCRPRTHEPGLDARGLRRPRGRRGRRADLPHELARGDPLRARPLRGASGDLRGRRTGGQGRPGARGLPRAGAHDHHDADARRPVAARRGQPRGRGRRARRRGSPGGGGPRRRRRRSSTRPARPGPRRAAC